MVFCPPIPNGLFLKEFSDLISSTTFDLFVSPYNTVDLSTNFTILLTIVVLLKEDQLLFPSSTSPWINYTIPSLKHFPQKAHSFLRKMCLHVHLLHLKGVLISFNSLVRDARAAYFSHLLTKNRGNPNVLFDNISTIVNIIIIAKMLEKVMAKQVTAILNKHSVLDKFQSAFSRVYSTETALLRGIFRLFSSVTVQGYLYF